MIELCITHRIVAFTAKVALSSVLNAVTMTEAHPKVVFFFLHGLFPAEFLN